MGAKQPTIPIDQSYTRVTMFLKSPDKSWTEVHWYASGSNTTWVGVPDLDTITAAVANNGLTQLRYAALATGSMMTEVRASQELIYKDSEVSDKPLNYPVYPPTSPANENVGNDCLAIRIESTDTARKTLYLGGVPDAVINNGVYIANSPSFFVGALQLYLNYLCNVGALTGTTNKWGFLTLNKDAAHPRVQIQSIVLTVGAPDVLTVTTVQNHLIPETITVNGILYPSVVRLSYAPNSNSAQPLNQLYTVGSVASPNQVRLLAPNWPPAATFVQQGRGGYLQNMVKTFRPYVTSTVPVAGTRSRGVTANLPLGRFKRKSTVGY
jgi:hypothetical protein